MAEQGDLSVLIKRLGHAFRESGLLSLALTHPSAAGKEGADNQRLEFLGDAVLELCVSDEIYARHPDMREGELTQLRAALVREESLAEAARGFGLGEFLRLDHGEEASGGRDKPSMLADAMEAVLAAVYLDGGLPAARAVCGRMLGDFTPVAAEPNWKSALQEREQARGHHAPLYHVMGDEGPPHARVFFVEVCLQDGRRAQGSGASKKQAEQEAAKAAMKREGRPGSPAPRPPA
ncbi:MAG: ribonuclease III [Firmicutes bacterium]|nr:ribonuclease III [Bacillota bacterium]